MEGLSVLTSIRVIFLLIMDADKVRVTSPESSVILRRVTALPMCMSTEEVYFNIWIHSILVVIRVLRDHRHLVVASGDQVILLIQVIEYSGNWVASWAR